MPAQIKLSGTWIQESAVCSHFIPSRCGGTKTMEEILCKYFEVVTYKRITLLQLQPLYREVMALINYKYNNYKCIQITISWVFFLHCTWESLCLQKQNYLLPHLQSPYIRPHSLEGTNHCNCNCTWKEQNPSKGPVRSQILASDRNPVGFYCNISLVYTWD